MSTILNSENICYKAALSNPDRYHNSDPEEQYPSGTVKKKVVKCPECGRKVKQRITFCDDGCCLRYLMPPHKRKGWWKKPKKQSRDDHLSRR